MKNLITSITFILFFSLQAFAQSAEYIAAMQSACTELATANDPATFTASYNSFARIAQAEPNDWLAKYHATYTQFMSGYTKTEMDMAAGQKLIDEAQISLNQLKEISTNPEQLSEVATLQAYIHMGKVIENPMVNGQTLTPLLFGALGEAEMLNPKNPRTQLIKGIYTLNMPTFIGGGVEAAKPILEKGNTLFADQKDNTINVSWGKNENQGILKKLAGMASN